MRTLEKEIKNNGTTYSLVKRTSWKAMYRAEGGHYEVFHIEIRPEVELFGKVIPEENKHKAKVRIKAMYAKWKLKRLEKQLEKEEKNG